MNFRFWIKRKRYYIATLMQTSQTNTAITRIGQIRKGYFSYADAYFEHSIKGETMSIISVREVSKKEFEFYKKDSEEEKKYRELFNKINN